MTKNKSIELTILCLFFFLNGKAQVHHFLSQDSLLYGRIQESVALMLDYMKFISTPNKTLATKQYYAQKAISLFVPRAVAIIKEDTKANKRIMPISDFFLQSIKNTDLIKKFEVDSIQVPNWENKRLLSSDSILWIDAKVIPIQSLLQFDYSDSLMVVKEITEEREEWRPLLGIIYLSNKHLKKNSNDKNQNIVTSGLNVDCIDNRGTDNQQSKSKHVRCKGKTRR